MAPLFANSLLRNIAKLFTEASDYNVLIEVGEGNYKENFKAHSVILGACSPYFKTELSSDLVKKENDKFIFSKPKISPKVFRKILIYIYTGEFSLKEDNIQDILLELLLVADELALLDLVKYMEEYIITYERDWIQENLVNIFSTVSKYQNFTRLYKYFCELLAQQPNTLFTSSYFILLDKTILLDFIKRDDLNIDEIEIWKNLVKWALKQNPKPLCHEIIQLTQDDWDVVDDLQQTDLIHDCETKTKLESQLKDFIPFIRFFNISKDDYVSEVKPYETFIPDDLRNELKIFFESTDSTSPIPLRIPVTQKVPDSIHINNKQLSLIASWIDSMDNDEINFNPLKNTYEFNLLLRGSRDGMGLREFHKLCLEKGPTLVIIKCKNYMIEQIIGGYNPKSWNFNGKAEYLEDAFLFSLGNGKDYDNIILSRAKYNEYSIRYSSCSFIGFEGLKWFDELYVHKGNYEKKIISNFHDLIIEDYEVFQVVKK